MEIHRYILHQEGQFLTKFEKEPMGLLEYSLVISGDIDSMDDLDSLDSDNENEITVISAPNQEWSIGSTLRFKS